MADSLSLSPALEDYLEAILRLVTENGVARVRDIARAVSVHKSTVTAALKSLSEKRLVNYSPYEVVTLTPKGSRAAREIVHRHEVLRDFLADVLLVGRRVAEANACRMEHVVDREVLRRLSLFAKFVKECPRTGEDWIERFRYYCEHGGHPDTDRTAAERWVEDFKRRIRQKRGKQEGGARTMTLDKLSPGRKARIVRIGRAGPLGRRLVDMGVVRGTPVEVIKVAPLGDPIEVKLKGYNLSLRKEEASSITVETE